MRSLFALSAAGVMLLASSIAQAAIKSEPVEYKQGDTTLSGVIYYDDAVAGKRPAVMVVHEWWGLNDYARHRAEEVAKLGYVGFAVDMYGKGVLAKDPGEAGQLAGGLKKDRPLMRQRIGAALDALKKSDKVDPAKVAVMGYCFGGTVALEAGRAGLDVVGIASFHGGLDSPSPADAKNIKGKVIVFHGADDPAVPAKDVAAFNDELIKAKVNYELNIYGGAVHAFTNPDADKMGSPAVRYNEQADKRSWARLKDFLAEVFAAK